MDRGAWRTTAHGVTRVENDLGTKPPLILTITRQVLYTITITSWGIDGKTVETVSDFSFWAPKSLQVVSAAMKLKDAYSLEGKL